MDDREKKVGDGLRRDVRNVIDDDPRGGQVEVENGLVVLGKRQSSFRVVQRDVVGRGTGCRTESLRVVGRDWDVNEGRRDSDAGGENEERREEHLFFSCWEQ